MNLQLRGDTLKSAHIEITGSKSESNRLLILQALYPQLHIENLSDSDDTQVLKKALSKGSGIIDIHHAGTAMRFLTAYFALKNNTEVTLTGSKRMQERPISILVEALRHLGADITYIKNEGFPPIKVKGITSLAPMVNLQANVSSQYISALMLIAPSLPNGLTINLTGKITSAPYIVMTLQLLKSIGVNCTFIENSIRIEHLKTTEKQSYLVESDWSSASYFYSLVALSEKVQIEISSFKQSSLQGDSALQEIYKQFGARTVFKNNTLQLSKISAPTTNAITLDLSNTPDIAQTIAVTCFGLGLSCKLTGLHTLKIKETDRLQALKTELEKLGAVIIITEDSLELKPRTHINENIAIETYNDHRMAMAFAPLALKTTLTINDAQVVSKSYPTFWKDLAAVGIKIIDQ